MIVRQSYTHYSKPLVTVRGAHAMRMTVSRPISRPAPEVFQFFADATNNPKWQKGMVSCTVNAEITGGPRGLWRLLEPLMSRRAQQSVDEDYDRLQRLLEAS